jgi:hypothetical protein
MIEHINQYCTAIHTNFQLATNPSRLKATNPRSKRVVLSNLLLHVTRDKQVTNAASTQSLWKQRPHSRTHFSYGQGTDRSVHYRRICLFISEY